ncbi:MAG: hypothetical protein VSS75_020430, partial [Candidatus Parabeggiatoa sp.]|nr:hypothetical protein [Candidatus Parabeggiatoa sp.]
MNQSVPIRQFQKNKIPKTTTLLYAYKSYVINCLLTQSRRAAENERRLIKGVGILIFWSYLNKFFVLGKRVVRG